MAEAFNFAREAKRLCDPRSELDAKRIHIWGGELTASGTESLEQVLERFLAVWNDPARQMPWRVWEYVDEIEFTKGQATKLPLLERGRVFGQGGDLSLRRDGERVLWYFVGKSWQSPPSGFDYADFWQAHPNFERLRWRRERSLLWGEYKTALERWQEDRVGRARLSYPVDATAAGPQGQRMMMDYIVLTDGGQVAFVWWRRLRRAVR